MPSRKLQTQRAVPGNRPAKITALLQAIGTVLVIFVALCIVYFPALPGSFLWDDDGHITKPELRSHEGLNRIWFDLGATQQYYPLLHSAFWLEYKFWGDATLGYHLINLAEHATAVFLVFLTLKRLKIPGAMLAAAIFALHPVNVESVAWISEQKNTLSAVFYLGAMLVYLHFDENRSWSTYLLATTLFVLGLLTKTVTATLPAALLLVFWWQRGKLSWRRDVIPLLPWFMLGLTAGLLTAWVEREYIGAQGLAFQLSFAQRILLAGRVPWFYLGNLFWPANLVFINPRWDVNPTIWWQWIYPLAAIALTVTLWLLRKRSLAPLAGWLYFVGTLFPALGFFNVYPFIYSFVADHFQYLASLGIIVLFASGVTLAFNRLAAASTDRTRSIHAFAAAGGVAIVGVLTLLTWQQSKMYGDVVTLYQTTIARNPDCWLAYNNLGVNFAVQNQAEDAVNSYRQAIQLNPNYAEAHFNLGNALARAENQAEAVEQYQAALQARPFYPDAYNNLGGALLKLNRKAEAIRAFQTAIQQSPRNAAALKNLGYELIATGNQQEAIPYLEKAAQLVPNDPELSARLGNSLLALGEAQQAIVYLQKVAKAQPERVEIQENTGIALAKIGRTAEAINYFKRAAQLDPENIKALQNLTTAYTQLNRRAEAIATAEQALARANATGKQELAQQIESWLKNYSAGSPRSGNDTPSTIPGQSR